MKGKMVFLALLASAVLCTQGFGFEFLRGGGCGGCNACDACAEPACCDPCGDPCCAPRCDLFSGLKGLFSCNKCCDPCGEPACCEAPNVCAPEPACCEPEPACCEPQCGDPCCKKPGLLDMFRHKGRCGASSCCEPEACEPECCEPCCRPVCRRPKPCCDPCRKRCCPGLLDLLDGLLGKKHCGSCCGQTSSCGEQSCCGGGAPAAAPAEEAAPLPAAPQADPSASLLRPYGIRQVSRQYIR